ncbi:hypothetical protein [Paludisphaera borealis]|uniref:Uncharacterized protein n=1 Tax=Paludisphaera borealis TaxID=1387353 RepID=A0A1U7CV72_9BACT|nr:hypothetical protein [Paludisphaera borealis]APW62847.1 hypothetical protein BSF38_04402 [Paludisphaera borealis]
MRPLARLCVRQHARKRLEGVVDPAWDEYKRRRHVFWLALLLIPLWLSGAIVLEFLTGREFPPTGWVTLLTVLLPPMLCLMVARLRLIFWPCPCCGRPFFLRLGNYWFTRRCLHCGLPKWAPGKAKSSKFIPLDQRDSIVTDDFDY